MLTRGDIRRGADCCIERAASAQDAICGLPAGTSTYDPAVLGVRRCAEAATPAPCDGARTGTANGRQLWLGARATASHFNCLN
jgi:hypothetical protein